MSTQLPTPTLDCRNGWLAPDGRLIPNPEFAYHTRMAEQICAALGVQTGDPRSHLVNAGWSYLRDCEWNIHRNDSSWGNAPERLTQKQRNTIFDWCMKHEKELPAFMRPETDEAALQAA